MQLKKRLQFEEYFSNLTNNSHLIEKGTFTLRVVSLILRQNVEILSNVVQLFFHIQEKIFDFLVWSSIKVVIDVARFGTCVILSLHRTLADNQWVKQGKGDEDTKNHFKQHGVNTLVVLAIITRLKAGVVLAWLYGSGFQIYGSGRRDHPIRKERVIPVVSLKLKQIYHKRTRILRSKMLVFFSVLLDSWQIIAILHTSLRTKVILK